MTSELNWSYSGIDYAVAVLPRMHGYGTPESWAKHIQSHVEAAYAADPTPGYLETGGWCATIWLNRETLKPHVKVTLSGYGVWKMTTEGVDNVRCLAQ